MGTTDPDNTRRRFGRTAIGVALLAVALAAAWGVHHRFVAPKGSSGSKVLQPRGSALGESPLDGAAGMGGLLAQARNASAGADDPGGLTPPPGATMRVGDTRRIGDQVVERAQYACDSSIDEVRSYYEELMARRGFDRAAATHGDDGSMTLVYVSSAGKAIVGLRKPSLDNTIDSIVVMFFRP